MTETEKGFHLMLDETPDDWDTRKIYADWLEEKNRNEEAMCQRWMIEEEKCPIKYPYLDVEIWKWCAIHQEEIYYGPWLISIPKDLGPIEVISYGPKEELPNSILRALPEYVSPNGVALYMSRDSAERSLMVALLKTGELDV